MFFFEWYFTAFTYILPLPLCAEVWRAFYAEGWPLVFRVVLALLEFLRPYLHLPPPPPLLPPPGAPPPPPPLDFSGTVTVLKGFQNHRLGIEGVEEEEGAAAGTAGVAASTAAAAAAAARELGGALQASARTAVVQVRSCRSPALARPLREPSTRLSRCLSAQGGAWLDRSLLSPGGSWFSDQLERAWLMLPTALATQQQQQQAGGGSAVGSVGDAYAAADPTGGDGPPAAGAGAPAPAAREVTAFTDDGGGAEEDQEEESDDEAAADQSAPPPVDPSPAPAVAAPAAALPSDEHNVRAVTEALARGPDRPWGPPASAHPVSSEGTSGVGGGGSSSSRTLRRSASLAQHWQLVSPTPPLSIGSAARPAPPSGIELLSAPAPPAAGDSSSRWSLGAPHDAPGQPPHRAGDGYTAGGLFSLAPPEDLLTRAAAFNPVTETVVEALLIEAREAAAAASAEAHVRRVARAQADEAMRVLAARRAAAAAATDTPGALAPSAVASVSAEGVSEDADAARRAAGAFSGGPGELPAAVTDYASAEQS